MKGTKLLSILCICLLALCLVSCDSVTDLVGDNTPSNNPGNGGTTPTFTVTFNANGGSGTAPGSQTVNAGSSVTLPNGGNLSKNGFTFGGWNTKADGTEINFTAGSSLTPTGNITLFAKWNNDTTPTPTTYTVTFDSNGGTGTTPSPQNVNDGSSVTLPQQGGLSKSGFTFGGWNTNADGTGINFSTGSSITPTGNITLYAQWDTTPITSVAIVVIAPVTGDAPVTTASVSGNFTVSSVSWSPATNNFFIAGVSYTVRVMLTANSGYSFTQPLNSTTINGENATIVNNNGSVVTLSFTFPATETIAGNRFTAKSYNANDKIKYSFSYGEYDFYYIYLGELANIPIYNFPTVKHDGSPGTIISASVSNKTETSIASEVTVFSQETIGIVDDITTSRTTGGKLSAETSAKAGAFGISAEVKTGAETRWEDYVLNYTSNSFQKTTSLTDTKSYAAKYVKTYTQSRSDDLGYRKAGYYRYSWFSVSDVYLYVIKDTKTNGFYCEFREYIIPDSFVWVLDYAPLDSPSFRKSDATGFIFDISIIDNLPKPVLDFGIPVANANQWNDAITAIRKGGNGTSAAPKKYTIYVTGNINIPGSNSAETSFGSVQNIEVTIKGHGILSLSSNQNLITIGGQSPGDKQKLIIDDENLTLRGRTNSDGSVLTVTQGGMLELKNGVITANNASGKGLFGGGVCVFYGNFTMSGGTISGNASGNGGGVSVGLGGSFTMNGGTISGNVSDSSGGGVQVSGNSSFTMSGGTISGNTSKSTGGGVNATGVFTMSGGIITENTAYLYGGGLWAPNFTKTGGTITGYASDQSNGNVVGDNSALLSNRGHAIYALGTSSKRKETTAGPNVNLSFNGSTGTFTGAWDN